MAQIVYQPEVDGDRPVLEQVFPDGNISTASVAVTVINKVTDVAVATSTGVAAQSTVDPTLWLYDTADITGINLETAAFAQLALVFTATLSTGGTIARRQTLVVNGAALLNSQNIYRGAVWIDTVAGVSGTDLYVNGTPTNPVDNAADAWALATALGVRMYVLSGAITLTVDHPNWTFEGWRSAAAAVVTGGGFSVNGSTFRQITIAGALGGAVSKQITAIDCILDTVTGWDGIATGSGIRTSLTLAAGPGSIAQLDNCAALTVLGVTVSANGSNTIQWGGATGVITIAGFTGGFLQIAAEAAILTLDATNVAGLATLAGFANVTNSSSMTIFVDETLNRQEFRDNMKLAPSAGAPAAGSVDEHLDDILADTAAIDSRLPSDPADESLQQAAHAQTQADIAALNDLDAQAVRDAQKLTPTGGAPAAGSVDEHLDDILADTAAIQPTVAANLDATVSSRESTAAAATRETNILAAIAALNNISIADVQTALTNQGYTAARALFLDEAISAAKTLTAAQVTSLVDAIWDEDVVAAHGTASSAGLLLRALGAAISARANNANLNALLSVADSPGETVGDAIDTILSAAHGAGAWTGSTPPAVAAAVWDALRASHVVAGSFGEALQQPVATAEANILAAIAALNDLSSGDVDTAITANAVIVFLRKVLTNRRVTNPTTERLEIWNDADTAVEFSVPIYEDVAESQGYRGQGIDVQRKIV